MGVAVPLLASVFVRLIWVCPGLFVPLPQSLDYDHSNANCSAEESCDRLDLRKNKHLQHRFTFSFNICFSPKVTNNAFMV